MDFDHQSLNPEVYVNDNVIDFWMMWVTRNVLDQVSSIVIFTSHFYSCLINNNFGLKHASQWIQNRRVDIFLKQIIMFPINLDKHWSLMVAYYPGSVSNCCAAKSLNDTDCAPIMLHLDSLLLHNGRIISEKLRMFLSWEWSKKKGQSIGDIFTDVTYPVFSPDGM
jgi:Ulp1 family protease